jgi:uracil-DNA glycosylase
MKLMIVAQSPGTETIPPPDRALEGSSSLRNLMRYSGLNDAEDVYRQATVVNLIPWYLSPNSWPSRAAEKRAWHILQTLDVGSFTHVVGLGVRVRHAISQASGVPENDWFVWHSWNGYWLAHSPHPSGLSREWNDRVTREAGQKFWRETLRARARAVE